MRSIFRVFIVLFCGIYVILLFGITFDAKWMISRGAYFAQNNDVFEECKLVNAPLWTDKLKKKLNPKYDPMKSCNRAYKPWSMLGEDGRVQISEHARKEAECRARAVLHKNDYKVMLGDWHDVNEEFVFENDIVEVECSIDEVVVYNFLHNQVWRMEPKTQPAPGAPSVHIVVIDSMGASHGRRVFTQTQQFLKEEFGAVEMQHVNKVGENSRPNGLAFLFGKQITNVKRDIFGLPSLVADWTYKEFCKTYLDDRGFILEQFEKNGYVTMMAEDWPKGFLNWPGCNGFAKQPVTHYMRPFQLHVRDSSKLMHAAMGNKNCFEPHLHDNEYHENFIKTYSDAPKVALTWVVDLAHDLPDNPFHSDPQYKQLFERNKEEFDNSFVFFMSDHGLRFGWYSQEPSGKRDNNNPMLLMSVPRRFRNDFALMANLRRNSGELITHFDTHATFVDIAETFSSNVSADFSKQTVKDDLWGSSLLRPLPGPRNCKTLPIPPSYCLCETQKVNLKVTDEHAEIGRFIASSANQQIANAKISRICAALELDKILSLTKIVGVDGLYDVTVQLRPGGGIFTASVLGLNGTFSLVDPSISRTNKYGHAGDCTTNNEIRTLCYCKSNLKKSKDKG